MKRGDGFSLASCMLVRLEDAGMIGAGHETLHQRFSLAINGEDSVERVDWEDSD